MYVSRPIRFPEDRPDSLPERPEARNGVAIAAVVFAVCVALASLVLGANGAGMPCPGDAEAECILG